MIAVITVFNFLKRISFKKGLKTEFAATSNGILLFLKRKTNASIYMSMYTYTQGQKYKHAFTFLYFYNSNADLGGKPKLKLVLKYTHIKIKLQLQYFLDVFKNGISMNALIEIHTLRLVTSNVWEKMLMQILQIPKFTFKRLCKHGFT